MRFILSLVACLVFVTPAVAQDDKGALINFLQSSLSGRGRDVQIDGFRGLLSSKASLDRLTIADDAGVWLTLEDAELEWSRAALISGRVEIQSLTAKRIDLPRIGASEVAASPEAGGFALPELPVSISIGQIKADLVTLGADVIGTQATVTLGGSMTLAGGSGQASLTIERLNGPRGSFTLSASYANATEILAIDLALDEAEAGIAATLLALPGAPALQMSVKGTGPLDDYTADVALRSSGQDRLTGRVSTKRAEDQAGVGARDIAATFAGDLAPMFLPEYRAFFGSDTRLALDMRLDDVDGTLINQFELITQSLSMQGNAKLDTGNRPESFNFNLDLKDSAGTPVTLPLSGPVTQVQSARIVAGYDASAGDQWNATAELNGLTRDTVSLGRANVVLDGTSSTDGPSEVAFALRSQIAGLDLGDAALNNAIGADLNLSASVRQAGDGPVEIRQLRANGAGIFVSGFFDLAGLNEAFEITGTVSADTDDMTRFAGISGLPDLAGQARIEATGAAALLGGSFDGEVLARTSGLQTGIASLDGLTKGEGTVSVSARRDTDGLVLREFSLTTDAVRLGANGNAATGDTELDFEGWLSDAALFIPDWSGPVTVRGTAQQTADGWQGNLSGTAPDQAEFTAEGEWPNGESPTVFLDGRIATVRSFVADLDGPADLTASLAIAEDGLGLFAEANGPAGTRITADGFVAFDGVVGDLVLTGNLPVGLANRQLRPNSLQGLANFNLKVNGPLAAQSVSGKITANGLRLSLPAQRNALENINASVDLRNGAGPIALQANVATGGTVQASGQISVVAPMRIGMDIQLDQIVARDPELYETVVSGPLRLEGPLLASPQLSGTLTLDRTELRIPSASIFGAELMQGVAHRGDTAAMQRTRDAAGLSAEAKLEAGGGASIGLDITIDASNRIFLRGRGLDAEMGGALRLSGSTSDIVPDGEFNLIRGRLDILGKRLDLEEGSAQLRGGLIPTIRLVAQTTTDELVISVIVEGSADAPTISFVSQPSLPDDEILAQLLFGRGITSLSALQAVQLGSAIATLAGRGGDGILERLRQNAGVDDLDVSTDESGNATLRAGKYISDNVYSDVSVDSQGGSSVTINLDLSPSTTVRGELDSDGQTAIGVYFEKDY